MSHDEPALLSPTEAWTDCRILVVDDVALSRRLVAGYLASSGINHVAFAENGAEALAKVESFEPDLIILDILMPEMDGFEVCRRLRADRRYCRLPILVQTGLDEIDQRVEIFRAGATDLVSKPLNGPELMARLRVHLENRLLIASLEAFRGRLAEELRLACEMQQDLLPRRILIEDLAARHSILLSAHVEASFELGGDHWGVEDVGDGRIALFIADFAGHGLTAAMNTFRLHALLHQDWPASHSPAAFLAHLNERMVDLLAPHHYATVFVVLIDTHSDKLIYAGAGAPSPLLLGPVREGLAEARVLDGSGVPIGITKDVTYQDQEADFPAGSALLLYSDAVTETPDHSGRLIDETALSSMALAARGGREPLPALLRSFLHDRVSVHDDLTLVWLERG